MAKTPIMVEYETDLGIYQVTAEDARKLNEDRILYGGICIQPNGDGTAKRIPPQDIGID